MHTRCAYIHVGPWRVSADLLGIAVLHSRMTLPIMWVEAAALRCQLTQPPSLIHTAGLKVPKLIWFFADILTKVLDFDGYSNKTKKTFSNSEKNYKSFESPDIYSASWIRKEAGRGIILGVCQNHLIKQFLGLLRLKPSLKNLLLVSWLLSTAIIQPIQAFRMRCIILSWVNWLIFNAQSAKNKSHHFY